MTALLSGRPGSQSRLGSGILAGASLLTNEQAAPVGVRSYTHLVADAHAPITADAAATFTITEAAAAQDAIAGASAASLSITSAAAAQAAEAAAGVASISITSASAAQDAIAGSAAGSFALTSAATAAALDAATTTAQFVLLSAAAAVEIAAAIAVGQIPFTTSAAGTSPLNANATGNLALMSASAAADAASADAAGLIVMVGGYVEPAIPDAPTITGIIWDWWHKAQASRKPPEPKEPERIQPIRYAVAIANLRIRGMSFASARIESEAAGTFRLVGSSGANMGANPADDEEMLLLALMAERMAA